MLKNLSIRSRLIFLLAVLCGLLIVTGFVGLRNSQRSLESLHTIYNRNVVRLRQLKIISDMYAVNIVDAAHKARNGNISPSEAAHNIDTAMSLIRRQWEDFSPGIHTAEEEQLILELTPLMRAADQAALDLRSMLLQENMEGVTAFIVERLYPTIDPITGKISNLIDAQLGLATSGYEAAVARYTTARAGALWIMGVALVIAVWFGWTIVRSISVSLQKVNFQLRTLATGTGDLGSRLSVDRNDEVGELTQNFNALLDQLAQLMQRIQNSGLEVHSASAQLSASAKQLQAVVSQQVAATNQVAATANHISATSEELMQTVTEVSGMSHDTAEFAGSGRETVARMGTAMKQMEEAVRSISGRLDLINDKASRIGTVITTIGKIADQTNVLSFNAAIEAEKAGEFGQGFAVVAKEIRRLADQTDVATHDIERMVKEMGSAVAAGVMSMDKFTREVGSAAEEIRALSAQLSHIIERVGALQSHFDSVSNGMQSQSVSAHEIHAAITDLSQGAEETAQSLRESNQAIQQLHHLAQQLHQEVGRFKLSRSAP